MANELRKYQNFVGGLVEDNPLTAGAVTLTSGGLAAITGGVLSTEHMAIVLDPDGIYGSPEVAWITALTAGGNSATIARGKENSSPREHLRDTPWVHAATARDIPPGVWVTYTPTITSAGWALGNGTMDARYFREGQTVTFRVRITWGSTSTYGSGAALDVTTPFVARDGFWTVSAFIDDTSTSNRYSGIGYISGTSTVPMLSAVAPNTYVTNTTPMAWATGDTIVMTSTYETTAA